MSDAAFPIATPLSAGRRTSRMFEVKDFTPVLRPLIKESAYDLLVRSYDESLCLYAVDEHLDSPPHPATIATAELSEWLGIGLDAAVSLVGLAASSRQYWRENPEAPIRPGKAGRLMRLHTAVGLLVGAVGVPQAQARLRSGRWLDSAIDDDQLIALEQWVGNIVDPTDFSAPAFLQSPRSKRELRRVVASPKTDLSMQARERQNTAKREGADFSPGAADHP